jgi:hypothetical protein
MGQIRASEDLLTLIRQMQEIWLFGKLDTIGDSKVQEETERDAKVIVGLLEQLKGGGGDVSGEKMVA